MASRYNVKVNDKWIYEEWVDYERAKREFDSWMVMASLHKKPIKASLVKRDDLKDTVIAGFSPADN